MPIRVIQTTAASAAVTLPWVPLNVHSNLFNVGWSINRTGNGHCEATIQYTLDNVLESNASAVAYTLKVLTTADTATAMSHTIPMAAIRCAIVSASGNNQVAFRVLQTGS